MCEPYAFVRAVRTFFCGHVPKVCHAAVCRRPPCSLAIWVETTVCELLLIVLNRPAQLVMEPCFLKNFILGCKYREYERAVLMRWISVCYVRLRA